MHTVCLALEGQCATSRRLFDSSSAQCPVVRPLMVPCLLATGDRGLVAALQEPHHC